MIKFIYLFIILTSNFSASFSQVWSQQQLDSANKAKDQTQLINVEKEAIMYINLARLYPKLFATIEVENYFGTNKYIDYVKNSKFRKSLIEDLKKREPVQRLYFDSIMFSFAKCFSMESGENGTVGHARINCTRPKGNFAECCSYGMETGKDIILQLLIDDDVLEVGHRITCLNKKYSKIGLSVSTHRIWNICAIADFSF